MGRTYSTHRKYEKCIHILVAKSERKRPFGRPRGEWENDINMCLG
jgi:hypothetical protein